MRRPAQSFKRKATERSSGWKEQAAKLDLSKGYQADLLTHYIMCLLCVKTSSYFTGVTCQSNI